MFNFKKCGVFSTIVAVGCVCGWTQAAQAQCQDGRCAVSPLSGTAASTTPESSFVSNTGIVNLSPTIGQAIYYAGSNCCGYLPVMTGYNVIVYGECWPQCGTFPSVPVSTTSSRSGTLDAALAAEAAGAKPSSCAGGKCAIR